MSSQPPIHATNNTKKQDPALTPRKSIALGACACAHPHGALVHTAEPSAKGSSVSRCEPCFEDMAVSPSGATGERTAGHGAQASTRGPAPSQRIKPHCMYARPHIRVHRRQVAIEHKCPCPSLSERRETLEHPPTIIANGACGGGGGGFAIFEKPLSVAAATAAGAAAAGAAAAGA
eukprot:CAMPEP_0174729638 /NCGR_PEP_ID=MMETSP1094-20130205/54054_1 /TAXON_ID=156173 /ORGANISM="Chrysochromulina brevifilum, Strain UTEX LB 985" /LENGTH=175 /DNA_ID=CAMNT_0015931771 /DNA_START=126 /DNA_END=651 /DNA_ORIENTATION=+